MSIFKKFFRYLGEKSFYKGGVKCKNLGKKLIYKKKIAKFLDLDCGNGELTMEFAAVVKPKEIYGIEFVDELIKKANQKGIKCKKGDLNERWVFDDNFFDLILSSQNIEHLHNTRLYLEECYRCLKKGGQLIILTENLASWVNAISLFFGWQPFSTTNINGWSVGNPLMLHSEEENSKRFEKEYKKSGVSGISGHVRVLAFGGLKDLLRKVGFQKIDIYTKGYLPFWGKLSDFLCKIDKRHGHFLIASAIKR